MHVVSIQFDEYILKILCLTRNNINQSLGIYSDRLFAMTPTIQFCPLFKCPVLRIGDVYIKQNARSTFYFDILLEFHGQ